jgi:hypothetical protein
VDGEWRGVKKDSLTIVGCRRMDEKIQLLARGCSVLLMSDERTFVVCLESCKKNCKNIQQAGFPDGHPL